MNARESAKEAFLAACAATFEKLIPSDGGWGGISFTQVEKEGLAHGRMLMTVLLEKWLELHPLARGLDRERCGRCEGPLRTQEDAQSRTLLTSAGTVEYQRGYVVCDHCGLCYAPLDCAVGIPPSGGSVRRIHQICHAAITTRSFEAADDTLDRHDGIEVSGKHVRVISETEGAEVVDARRKEVDAFRGGQAPQAPAAPRDLLVVTADGGRLRTRRPLDNPPSGPGPPKRSSWREDKLGSVYDAEASPEPGATSAGQYRGARAQTKTYVASLVSWEEFGWMLCVEAWRRGYPQARTKLFISDGAEALRTLRQTHFPDAQFILDWYHGVEHLSNCGKAAFGEGTVVAEAWYEEMKDRLWEGDVDAILRAVEKESKRVGAPVTGEMESSPRLVLHRNLHYFAENRDGMAYPRFRKEGWPLASGIAEGGVKQIGMRMKGSEKFWNHVGSGLGAEEMLALCALYLCEDGRWDAYWDARARPYRREVLLE